MIELENYGIGLTAIHARMTDEVFIDPSGLLLP